MPALRHFAVVLALLVFGGAQGLLAEAALAGPCDPPNNEIVCENSKAGSPPSVWDVNGAGASNIQGFSTNISVNQGGTIGFKVNTVSSDYRLDIYRMGYYGGNGARKVATVDPSVSLPQSQPACAKEPSTGLVDCGNWTISASWTVPSTAVSGIYFAKLEREDATSEGSHIIFIVRDDDGESDLLFQTSDTTWQAYNQYGGNSLYVGSPGTNPGRAYKVSYNRPLTVRQTTPEDSPFNAEYPMVRWLERNGYDVSYTSGVDTARSGAELLEHEAFLSVGHDEYWSAEQRDNVEAARDAGVNLAFFSGNEIFWKTRWEPSIDGSGTNHRTLVCYKETHFNGNLDPDPDVWTGTWRDPRFSPPADGGEVENALSGTAFMVNAGTTEIKVPAEDGQMRLWRDTDIAELGTGQTATLAEDTLGYEWDEDLDNGFRPEGLVRLSSTTTSVPQKLQDYGNTYSSGTATHHLTLYRADSGALVFGAGTVQWPWGLDSEHDRGNGPVDPRMQQATVNLFADMGVQPQTLQAGMVAATQTSDDEAPVTTVISPADGAEVEVGQTVTLNGVASDSGGEGGDSGVVGAVEVSVDEGESWHPAKGRDAWNYTWTPNELGEATVLVRAVDDSGNIEDPAGELTVEVAETSCPCTIWDEGVTGGQDNDSKAVELGTKFRSDVSGFATGVRYYRTAANAGPHSGRLWTRTGVQLAQVTFNGESASGWQQANFDTPVALDANTTYVVSYHAPAGKYAAIKNYFQVVGVDNPPLHALANGVDGPNGIYEYGPAGGLFADGSPSTFQSESYLVDVVFEEEIAPDTTAPQINGRTPPPGATEVSTGTTVSASFNEPMNPTTIDGARVELRDSSNNLIPATVSYNVAERRVTLDPTPTLQLNTTYTAKVKGGVGGVTDVAGNPLAATSTWSFTTVPPPPPPPDEGPGGPILVIANEANPFSRYYGEILRAEGLNQFTVTDISNVTPALLAARDVAILGEGALSPAQATTLSDWVQAGGNLIAMRPDSDLTSLLGLTTAGGSLANAYLDVDTGSSPGAGIVSETMQYHGTADRYTLNGAQAVATLYSDASTATANPAVTLRSVGANGGQAAAFAYDLARSVVYTRQGNPAWAGQERDAMSPIRSDDLFFGNKAGDAQSDWVNLDKVAIPQADEQQRLLTNLIGEMNLDRKPLPRFWFLPRDEKAAVVMTGDDHAQGGTAGRLEHHKAISPPGCDVDAWECVRSTSYLIPNNPLLPAKAASLVADGFEIAVHTSTGCQDWSSEAELLDDFEDQLETFAANYPSLPPPTTNRLHCIVWSDWASQAKVSLKTGIRFDTNYYYWPGAWVKNRPGMFTGSGMPMRFADLDGSLIDVYQATTQMTDESGQTYPFTSDTLLDRALGAEQYFGVFTANMHTDDIESPNSDAIVSSAMARDVPVVSARQMLTWIDGRNQSSFGSVSWAGTDLSFTISPGAGANGLRAMVPVESDEGPLDEVTRNGTPVATTTRTIKGVEYAFFDAVAGNYTAAYLSGSLPFISDLEATAANDGTATVKWTTNKAASSRVDYGTNPASLGSSKTSAALVTSHSLQLTGLSPNTTYHFRATSTDSEAKSVTKPNPPLAPQTFLTPPVAPTLSSTVPASPSNVNTPKVLGSATAGSTVQLYATASCTGSPLATGTAAALAAGIEVTVPENATTALRATATTAGGSSACSTAISYVEDSTAPAVQVDTGPNGLTKAPSPTFTFSSEPGAVFACSIDTGTANFAPCSGTGTHTPAAPLSDGPKTFRVRATDAAGNQGIATRAFTVDATAPDTAISVKPNALTNSTEAEFGFTGSDTGGSGVASFECKLDSGAFGACTSPRKYTGLTPGSHSFEVRALDLAGNTDGTPATHTWTIDTTAPTVTADSLSKALLKAGETSNFTWHANENGSFQLRVGGADCDTGTVLEAGSYSTQPNTRVSAVAAAALAEGANTLRLCITDAAGNRGSTTQAISKDTVLPETTIGALKPAALSNSAEAEFGFTGADTGGSGVASIECKLDSGAFAACTSPRKYTGLGQGAHKLEVRAIDQAGNVDASPASYEWTVDTVAPAATITGQPPAISASPLASFSFTGADPGGSGVDSFECRRDSVAPGDWQPCKSALNYNSLAEGLHKFEVRAIDKAGNVDSNPPAYEWRVDTVAPDTQITAQPPALTNSNKADFSFQGSDGGSGIASLQCRIDSSAPGAWTACTSPQQYTGLADGAHTFEVRAIDKAGNVDGSPATYSWQINLTPPTVTVDSLSKALLKAGETSNLTWHANENGNFSLRVGGSDCASGTAIDSGAYSTQPDTRVSAVAAANLAEGANTLRICVTNGAGSTGQATTAINKDTGAPDTTITVKPTALTNSTTADFAFTGNDGSGSGVASFECKLDSGAFAPCATPLKLTSLSQGSHKLEVRAIDNAGNADGSPASHEWTVDTTPPNVSIDTGANGPTNDSTPTFTFGSEPGASFECSIDTGTADFKPCSGAGTHTPASSLPDGARTFRVRATDGAGNQGVATRAFSVDLTAPDTTITAQPLALSNSTTADFSFSGSDTGGSGVASFECRLDSSAPGAWAACTSPRQLTGLGQGSHTFEVRAVDQAGNPDATPAAHTWSVDAVAPETAITASPPALSSSTTADFSFSGSDVGGSGVASLQCRLDSSAPGAWASCTSPRQLSGLGQGSHTFEVRAIDTAGNVDASPATHTWTIDTASPDTTIGTKPAALTNSTTADFTFTGSDPGGSGIASFECKLDSGAFAPCTSPRQLTSLAQGSHKLEVRALDNAGNADGSPASHEWAIDTTVPTVTVDSLSKALLKAGETSNLTWHANENGNFQLRAGGADCDSGTVIDSGAYSTQPNAKVSAVAAAALAEGANMLRLCLTDAAGNRGSATGAISRDTGAPDTTIGTKPAASTNSTTADFTFTGSDPGGSGIASFECKLDSGSFAPCTSPRQLTELAPGSHSFEVRAIDQAGNADGSPATHTWTVDQTPPAVQIDTGPTGLTNDSTPTYTFSSEPGASFECSIDTGTADFKPCSGAGTHTPAPPLPDGARTFRVRATDGAGNQAVATRGFTVDATPPDTAINSKPSSPSKLTTVTLTFNGFDPGGSGVASFECKLDGGPFAPCASPRQLSELGQGSHTFEVRAIDNAGNADATPATHTWTVDTTAPSISIDSGPAGLTKTPSPTFTFSSEPGATFACSIDTGTPNFAPCSGVGTHTPASPLSDGARTFRVRVTDGAGNEAIATRAFSVDATAPDTTITGQPPALSNSDAASFSFQGSDGGSGIASFECKLDSGAFAPCVSGVQLTDLEQGSHTFHVRAIDNATNPDSTPATHTWTVDTVAPAGQIDTGPTGLTKTPSPTFTFSSEPGATLACSIDTGTPSFAPCSGVGTHTPASPLSDGARTFRVRATDAAGNEAIATRAFSVDATAPDTTITTKPAALTNSATADFTFSGNDGSGSGIASFECRLDSGSFAPCATPLKLTSLSPGAHSLEVRALDNAGNPDATSATHAWTIDTTTPTVTADSLSKALLKAGETSNLTWHANENGNFSLRVGGADCDSGTVIDSGAYATQPNAKVSAVAAAALAEGANMLRLCLTDAAGNRGSATGAISRDTGAPDTTIGTKPAASTNSTTADFTFTGSDPVGSGIASFECKLDSGAYQACVPPLKLTSLGQGSHKLEVRAVDSAGNADGSPASHEWVVDSTAPNVSIDTGPTGLTNDSTPTFTFSSEPGVTFACSIDTGTPSFAPCSGTGTHTPAPPLPDGARTFRVRVTDGASNQAVATRSFTVDTAAPAAPELTATMPASPANSNSPKVVGTASAGVTVRLYANADCSGAPTAIATAAELAAGIQVSVGNDTLTQFSATATTTANNTSGCSDPISYREDSTAPETTITTKPSSPTKLTTAELGFSGNDGSGSGIASFECRLDSSAPSAWVACANPRQLTDLSQGSHKFEVRAIDQAGNIDASPAAHTWTVDTTAPNVSIDGGPSGLTADSTPTYTFSAEPGASFECSVDTGTVNFAPCSGAGTHTPASSLGDGPGTFRVRATDQAGNQAVATRGFNVDSTAPDTTINAQPPALSGSDAASFSFNGSDAGSGVASFECRLDSAAPGAWTACTSPRQLTAIGQGGHSFEVRAVDAAGNRDATPSAHTWTVDTVAPQTEIASGPDPVSASPNAAFTFSATDAGGSGIAAVQCRRDADEWIPCSSPRSFSALAEGNHKFEVRAVDQAGNTDPTPAEFEWTIDTQAPDTTITTKPNALANSTTADFAFTGSDPGGSGIASFECKLDSGSFAPCASPRQLTSLGQGAHRLEVRALDNAGNVDASPAVYEWAIDSAAPQTTIDSQPSAQSTSADATFTFSGSDVGTGVASFQCRLDSTAPGAWQTCASPRELNSLAQGSHTFEVRAIDNAGNADATPATHTWTVDTIAPNVSIDTGPNGLTNDSTPTFTFSSEAGAAFECSIDTGTADFKPCSGAGTHTPSSPLAEGGYTFRVRATDAAGNTGVATRGFSYEQDSTAPAIQIDSGPAGATNDSTPTFTFSSEPGVTFACSIDTGTPNFAPCSGAGTHTPSSPLADGPYTFRVRAADGAGNQATASRAFSVDTTPDIEPGNGGGGSGSETPGGDPPPGLATAKYLRVVHDVKTGKAQVIFDVTGPGLLSARSAEIAQSSKRLRAQSAAARAAARSRQLRLRQRSIKPTEVRIAKPGEVALPIELTAAGKKALKASQSLKVKVLIRFETADGAIATWKLTVTLKKRPASVTKSTRPRGAAAS